MSESLVDNALVQRLRARDHEALGELYDRHGGALYGLARSIVTAPEDAEEVVEDAFIRLWEDPNAYDRQRGSVAAYLAIVVRSRALDRIRSGKRRESAVTRSTADSDSGFASPMSSYGESPDQSVERAELRSAVATALQSLPEAQRRALELAYYGGYSQSEIAQRLGQPLGTIKTRIRDGMRKLKEALAPFARGAA